METTLFSNRISELIKENQAAEEAYAQVVQGVENAHFGKMLDRCIQERIRFQTELKEVLGETGGNVTTADSHPSWLHIREIFPTSNDAAMLEETIRGENRTIDMYNSVVIDPEIPADKAAILREHIARLRNSISELNTFRDRASAETE